MSGRFDPLFGALVGEDWFPSPAHVMRRAAITDAFSKYPPGKLIEMGCGAGRMLADWHNMGHVGRAVDLDATARALATQCVEAFHLNFEVSDRAGRGPYDYLVATEVLEHIEDPATTLNSWLSTLSDDGVVVLTVPAFRKLWATSDEWAGHVTRFEPHEFRHLVESAGLHVEHMRLYGFPIGNALRIVGNFTSGLKVRQRREPVDRDHATLASGHDRSFEKRVAPLMRSPFGRLILRAGIALQRRFNRGHGLIVVARMRPRQ